MAPRLQSIALTCLILAVALVQAATQSTFENLVAGTTGTFTALNGWDLMVAYDFNALQDIISNEIQSKPKVLSIPTFSDTLSDPFTGQRTTTSWVFHLSLTVPKVNPINDAGYLSVQFPLAGYYYDKADEKKTRIKVPAGILVDVKAPLYNTGMAIQNKIPAMKTAQLQPNQASNTMRVCFELESHTVTITGLPRSANKVTATALLLAHLTQHFATQQVEYCLSSLKANSQNLKTELDTLIPNAVSISTLASDGDNPGALILWLAFGTGAVPFLTHPQDFSFNPGGAAKHPIPTGFTSAVWFSHDLLMNKMVLPSLMTRFTSVSAADVGGSGGLSVTGTFPSLPAHFDSLYDDDDELPAIDYNPNDTPFTFNLAPAALPVGADPLDLDSPVASINYAGNMISEAWDVYEDYEIKKRYVPGSDRLTKRHGPGWYYGLANVVYSTEGGGAWSNPDPESMLLSIALPNTFSANWTYSDPGGYCNGDNVAIVPTLYKNFPLPAVPNVGPVTVGPVNFSLASTLLSDARYGFNAAGGNYMAVPWDMVIAGDIVKIPTTIKTKDHVPWTQIPQIDYTDLTLQSLTVSSYQACRNACDRYTPDPNPCSAAVFTYMGSNKGNCDLKQGILSPIRPVQGVYTSTAVRSVQYTTQSGLVWTRAEGVDYPGVDVSQVAASTWEACLEACDAYTGPGLCLGAQWTPAITTSCYLKADVSGATPVTDGSIVWTAVRPPYVTADQATFQQLYQVGYTNASVIRSETQDSFEGCANLCDASVDVPRCAGITWVYSTGDCYLFDNTASQVDADTLYPGLPVISASRSGRVVSITGKVWNLQANVDYPGNDMSMTVQPTYEACMELCNTWTGPQACVGFVWVYSGQGQTLCYLKNSMNNAQPPPSDVYVWSGQSDNGCPASWCDGTKSIEASGPNYPFADDCFGGY